MVVQKCAKARCALVAAKLSVDVVVIPDGYKKFPGGMLLRSHLPPHSFMQGVYRRTSHPTEMNEKFVFNVEKESDCPLSVISFIVVNFE